MTRFLVALGCLGTVLPRMLTAQSDTTAPGLRLHFAQPLLTLEEPAVLRAWWMGAPRIPPGLRALAFDSALTAILERTRRDRVVGIRLAGLSGGGVKGAP